VKESEEGEECREQGQVSTNSPRIGCVRRAGCLPGLLLLIQLKREHESSSMSEPLDPIRPASMRQTVHKDVRKTSQE